MLLLSFLIMDLILNLFFLLQIVTLVPRTEIIIKDTKRIKKYTLTKIFKKKNYHNDIHMIYISF